MLLNDEDRALPFLRLSARGLRRVAEVAHLLVLLQQVRHGSLRRLSLLRRRAPRRRLFRGRLRWRALRRCAPALPAPPQRFHDVDDFAALVLFLLFGNDGLALRLVLDAIEEPLAILVLVLKRIEF